MGTDHAGIATQMLVERQLKEKEGIASRHDIGRESLIERIWEWKATSSNTIADQMRRMGVSVDWSTERFTMDEGFSKAVREAFIRLHKEGLIYRGKKLVNWDPVLHTAISDLEVNNQEEKGLLYSIRFPLVDSKSGDPDYIVIATTRPETLLGDVACAVHPDDERYKTLVGKMLRLPLANRNIPIIADEHVKTDFGTGIVKITPAHDFNDYAMAKRHELPLINILTPSASMNDQVPPAYRGLDRFEARERIVSDLDAQGLLEKTEPHTLSIPRGDRSGSVVEPYLTDQWFIKMKPLAAQAIKAAHEGKPRFHPENWLNMYLKWLETIEDWCISRQLWWGHQIPVWHDESGLQYVGQSESDVRQQYNLADSTVLRQDEDVLDTWFSSALWPFATLGWPEQTARLSTFYPSSVLVTGFDIIFFWVARMVMMGLKLTDQVPFQAVYITGLIRDEQGRKMSKSKGNVLDPIDLVDGIDLEGLLKKRTANLMQSHYVKAIEKATRQAFPQGIKGYGSDALRFTFCALASTGRDIRFDTSRLEGYRNFCNKLWNAARYVLTQATTESDKPLLSDAQSLHLIDRWILHELQQVIDDAHKAIEAYRFDWLAKRLYEFTWHTYCDWYLELTKFVLSDASLASQSEQQATRCTLVYVLETLLRLLHPIIPYITEEIWQRLIQRSENEAKSQTIMLAEYPISDQSLKDNSAAAELQWIQLVITQVRTLRSEMNLSPAQQIPLIVDQGNDTDYQRIDKYKALLTQQLRLKQLSRQPHNTPCPPSATVLAGQLKLLIPMQGLIDKDAEIKRLEKALKKIEANLKALTTRLNNPNYVANAPEDIVTQTREQVKQLELSREKYQLQLKEVLALI